MEDHHETREEGERKAKVKGEAQGVAVCGAGEADHGAGEADGGGESGGDGFDGDVGAESFNAVGPAPVPEALAQADEGASGEKNREGEIDEGKFPEQPAVPGVEQTGAPEAEFFARPGGEMIARAFPKRDGGVAGVGEKRVQGGSGLGDGDRNRVASIIRAKR